MASKRDLLQSHQFLAQRVISALVTNEPDPEQPPFRRPTGATVGSLVLAIVALVAVGVYGLVNPGGKTAWRDRPSVIVEKETGARYVYLDGVLHPVTNYASALLTLGQHAETVSVSNDSLLGVPRGRQIGIPDAPDTLPPANKLLTGGWSICSRTVPQPSGATVDESVLLVGTGPSGGRSVTDAALLVDVPATGDQYLISNSHRHRIRASDTVTVGLALQSAPRTRTGMAVVDTLPAGAPIAPIRLADAGTPSTAVPQRTDLRAGQLLVVETSGEREYFLAEVDRLRPISPLQYDIQRADPDTRRAYGGGEPVGIPLGPAAAAEARREPSEQTGPGTLPPTRPRFVNANTVCATYEPSAAAPVLHVDPQLPDVPTMPTPRTTQHGMPMADRVHVEAGRAALVEVMPSAAANAGTLALITDQGKAYPLASPAVPGILGYGEAKPVRLPAEIVGRVPLGSGLDPAKVLG
ncbi:type VII secretion protein EccB [Amycolatopsis anabasis]|uniref:type VII secretion protein EccB n=1 Tax=Amycolatopsis anabasis TaxID=1840409 RepID=UPI00131B7A4C|nr:type VII secretion protein EccB [Amycolatopsis anabasis]